MRKAFLSVALVSMLVLSVGAAGASTLHESAGVGKGCTKGYSPCLAYHHGADYDCYGGGGNGPYFTKRGVVYHVTGSDPYRLDSNHNRKGCE